MWLTFILAAAATAFLTWLAWKIEQRRRPIVGRFGAVKAIGQRKVAGMDIMEYRVGLPISESGDVVKKVLNVKRTDTADGVLEAEETIEMGPLETAIDIEAVQGSQVDLSLVAVDDVGNVSAPVTLSFLAADTIPPKLTGELTVAVMSERTVPPEPGPDETADEVAGDEAEADDEEPATDPAG